MVLTNPTVKAAKDRLQHLQGLLNEEDAKAKMTEFQSEHGQARRLKAIQPFQDAIRRQEQTIKAEQNKVLEAVFPEFKGRFLACLDITAELVGKFKVAEKALREAENKSPEKIAAACKEMIRLKLAILDEQRNFNRIEEEYLQACGLDAVPQV